MKTIEYKAIIFATGFLLALAWSWLPWTVYNAVVLTAGILPPAGYYGWLFITLMCWGAFAAIVEHKNPRTD